MNVRAVVFERFGPPEVLALVGVPKPVPKPDEVLIKVYATTVTAAEAAMRRGRPLWGRVIVGFFRPRRHMRRLGIEFAGEIEAVGAAVTRFSPGDEVFGFTGFQLGAHAQYLCLPERASLALKPRNASFEEAAAAVDGASTALYFLQGRGDLRPGQKVLVIGASGSIGTYAVQIAKHLGAEVTGVCSTTNVELVRSLGADEVIDYTREDFTRRDEAFDLVFDTVGRSSFSRCKRVLTPTGRYLPTTGLLNYAWMAWTRRGSGKRVMTGMSVKKHEALTFIRERFEAGELRVVIDRRYSLEEIVEAHRHVDSGHKRGNVVIHVDHEQPRSAVAE